ncbi:hypothetical protein ACFLQI_02285 [Candidatus Undinarchaeota archaeon]
MKDKECNYHDCDAKGTKWCIYCEERFCKAHSKPRQPRANTAYTKSTLEDELDMKKQGHACPAYYDAKKEREKRKTDNVLRALDGKAVKKSSWRIGARIRLFFKRIFH